MGTGYTRTNTSDIQADEVVKSAPLNAELNAVVNAFASSTGHSHDGTAAEGGPISSLQSMTIQFGVDSPSDGDDVVITCKGQSNDGIFRWMEDEDYFRFDDNILINSTGKIQFGDTASFIQQSSNGVLRIDGENTIDLNAATVVDVSGALTVGGTLTLGSTALTSTAAELNILDGVTATATELNIMDGVTATTAELNIMDGVTSTTAELNILDGVTSSAAELNYVDITTLGTSQASKAVTVDSNGDLIIPDSDKFKFGAGSDMQLYHDGSNSFITNATGTLKLATETSGIAVTIGHTTSEVTVADNLTVTGTTTLSTTSFGDANIINVGDIALDSISADGTDINVAITDNSATSFTIKQGSDAYLIVDTGNSSESVSIGTGVSGTAITIGHGTSEVTIGDNLTVAGNLTVTGTQTVVDTVTMNAQNAIVFEGSTADANETTLTITDPDADRTIKLPNQSGTLVVLAADSDTAVTATPAEISILDGDTSATSTTIVDADRVVFNDSGTMKQVAVTDLAAYFDDEITAMPNLVTTGALNSGSIATGFGAINNGSSAITTSGTISFGSLTDGSVTITDIADEDDFTSDSATKLATQQSIKAYVTTVAGQANNVTGLNATGTELNAVADGDTSASAITIVDADRIPINDNGTMKQIAVTTLAAYLDDEITAMPNLLTTAATTVGALDSGSITSGFGAIDNGTSGIRTNTVTVETSLLPDASGGADIGSSSAPFGQIYVADDKYIQFGSNQDVLVGYDEDGDDCLEFFQFVEGAPLALKFSADQGDDNADVWKLNFADGGTITWNSKTSGSYATKKTLDTSGNLTITGELDAATLDISGNADIDGVLEADDITINGTNISSIYGAIAGSSSIVTTGALDAGSISSGFGNIDVGSSNLTATGTISLGATSFNDNNITNVGNIALDSLTADGSSITITGDTTFADGAYDFDIASHDGSNGLKLGGTLVTATAAEINNVGNAATTGKAIAMAMVFG